jgi:uncharacterized protein (TIGR00251 family)
MSSPLSETPEGVKLALRVTPRAARNELGAVRDGRLQVRVTVAPEDGKANEAVIKLLAKSWRIAAGSFEIVSGHTSRDKLVLLRNVRAADVPL